MSMPAPPKLPYPQVNIPVTTEVVGAQGGCQNHRKIYTPGSNGHSPISNQLISKPFLTSLKITRLDKPSKSTVSYPTLVPSEVTQDTNKSFTHRL